MHSFISIIPIFAVILLGFLGKKAGFLNKSFIKPANGVVFYVAIPALLFLSISKANFNSTFQIMPILATLSALILVWITAFLAGKILKIPNGSLGTFLQASTHGNIAYFAFPVAFYTLGNNGLILTGIIGSFLIIAQNILSISSLSFFNKLTEKHTSGLKPLLSIIKNPIIISSIAALFFSYEQWHIPIIIERTLKILSGMALPVALLVIGSSLSLKELSHPKMVVTASLGKLIVLPAFGIAVLKLFAVTNHLSIAVVSILLAAPSATVTNTMALEMKGDEKLAAAAVTVTIFLSIFTYTIWL